MKGNCTLGFDDERLVSSQIKAFFEGDGGMLFFGLASLYLTQIA